VLPETARMRFRLSRATAVMHQGNPHTRKSTARTTIQSVPEMIPTTRSPSPAMSQQLPSQTAVRRLLVTCHQGSF